jgi:hypothetical protein
LSQTGAANRRQQWRVSPHLMNLVSCAFLNQAGASTNVARRGSLAERRTLNAWPMAALMGVRQITAFAAGMRASRDRHPGRPDNPQTPSHR